tara:strand:+ start:757 stop:1068 length:312 start_codon:yes stop_codon:yes gene_type:complete
MEDIIINFNKISLEKDNDLLNNIKKYIDFINNQNQYTNKDLIIAQDNYWRNNVNSMSLGNLIDYINETINDENNIIISYLNIDIKNYQYNILMFLDYIIHTVF